MVHTGGLIEPLNKYVEIATASTAAVIVDGVSFVLGQVGDNTGWW